MKLGDAIALGYSRTSGWTTGAVLNDNNEGCALGLALIGLGLLDSGFVGVLDLGTRRIIARINDNSESYEDMMLQLKRLGYDQIEVTPLWE